MNKHGDVINVTASSFRVYFSYGWWANFWVVDKLTSLLAKLRLRTVKARMRMCRQMLEGRTGWYTQQLEDVRKKKTVKLLASMKRYKYCVYICLHLHCFSP